PNPLTSPANTFFRHNSVNNPVLASPPNPPDPTLDVPFTWLTHLDRPVVNSVELMHVSAFAPHMLTQQFITAAGSFQHYAPWNDQTSMIFRALELLGVPSYLNGTAM